MDQGEQQADKDKLTEENRYKFATAVMKKSGRKFICGIEEQTAYCPPSKLKKMHQDVSKKKQIRFQSGEVRIISKESDFGHEQQASLTTDVLDQNDVQYGDDIEYVPLLCVSGQHNGFGEDGRTSIEHTFDVIEPCLPPRSLGHTRDTNISVDYSDVEKLDCSDSSSPSPPESSSSESSPDSSS